MEPETLEKLKLRRDSINARISRFAVRKQGEQRRLETRRKIVAGGILLAAVARDPALEKPTGIARWWNARLLEMSREQDRKLFEPDSGLPESAKPERAAI